MLQENKNKRTIDKRNLNRNIAMRVFVFRNLASRSVVVLSDTVTAALFFNENKI
jgi:hypothetical protein